MKTIITLLLVLMAAVSTRAQIDLTPTPSTRVLEGIEFKQVEFRDGDRKVTYEPPRGWQQTSYGPNRIVFTPNVTLATAGIEVAAQSLPPFDEAGVEAAKQIALTTVPPDSTDTKAEQVSVNGVYLGEHQTCEVVVSYTSFGQAFKRSLLLVEMGKSHLRFAVTARADDFASIHRAFASTVTSWQWAPQPGASNTQVAVATATP